MVIYCDSECQLNQIEIRAKVGKRKNVLAETDFYRGEDRTF